MIVKVKLTEKRSDDIPPEVRWALVVARSGQILSSSKDKGRACDIDENLSLFVLGYYADRKLPVAIEFED